MARWPEIAASLCTHDHVLVNPPRFRHPYHQTWLCWPLAGWPTFCTHNCPLFDGHASQNVWQQLSMIPFLFLPSPTQPLHGHLDQWLIRINPFWPMATQVSSARLMNLNLSNHAGCFPNSRKGHSNLQARSSPEFFAGFAKLFFRVTHQHCKYQTSLHVRPWYFADLRQNSFVSRCSCESGVGSAQFLA